MIMCLVVVDASGAISKSKGDDRDIVVAVVFALGAIVVVDELLALDCPAVVLVFAFALGAGVDARFDPVLGVGNTGAGFKCEYVGNASCGTAGVYGLYHMYLLVLLKMCIVSVSALMYLVQNQPSVSCAIAVAVIIRALCVLQERLGVWRVVVVVD